MNIITTIVHEQIIYREVLLLEEACVNLQLKYLPHIINSARTFSPPHLDIKRSTLLSQVVQERRSKEKSREERERGGRQQYGPLLHSLSPLGNSGSETIENH